MGSNPANTPIIIHLSLAISDTEYEFLFPSAVENFSIQAHEAEDVRFAYQSGKVATPTNDYGLIKAGGSYYEPNVALSGITIYLATSAAPVTLEIIMWK